MFERMAKILCWKVVTKKNKNFLDYQRQQWFTLKKCILFRKKNTIIHLGKSKKKIYQTTFFKNFYYVNYLHKVFN